MTFDLVESTVSLLSLVPLVMIFVLSAKSSPYGAVSLPCMTMLTSFIYFYLMPVLTLATGDPGFFGIFITSLEKTHMATALYAIGAGAAFLFHWRTLQVNPAATKTREPEFAPLVFGLIWGIVVLGLVVQIATGRLNLAGAEDYQAIDAEGVSQFAFLTQSYNMMVSLTIVALVRDRFGTRSLLLLLVVLVVFLQAGFRFRIMIMLAGIGTAYAFQHGRRIGVLATTAGMMAALVIVNVVGSIRSYGQGVRLDALDQIQTDSLLSSFGGEFGIVYVLSYTADNPLPDPVTFEPWIVGFARLVPSFLWQDKPVATYMRYFISGTTVANADKAGIAAPQHVEMLYQFGWIGLPVLAFIYFGFAATLVTQLLRLERSVRIAGCALVPSYFGFYMQTRGYFFQIFADGLFIFLPLFMLQHKGVYTVESALERLKNKLMRAENKKDVSL